jgi:c-di-GMP-binding flagellar brake protein YcgR
MNTSDPGRRRYRRRAVHLAVTLRFKPPRALREKQADLMLIGRTKDLSEGGMAIIVSAGNIDRYLKQQENNFQVELKLPDGLLSFEATPVHFNRFMTATGASYVIGSRLSKLEPSELERLMEFLKALPLI